MTSPDPPPPLTLRLLGPLEVLVHGAPLPRLRSRKGAWLLALLVLRRGGPVEREWLAGTLWDDPSAGQPLASLRKSLTDLRRAMGPEAARLSAPTPRALALDLSGAEVDLLAFDAAINRGDREALEEAVALYRGPLLEGCGEVWVPGEREWRRQAYLETLEKLAAQALAAGRANEAERYLRRVVAVDAHREECQRALMETLAAGGHYAGALQVYRDLEVMLKRANLPPKPETTRLFQRIRDTARTRAAASASLPARAPAAPAPAASLAAPAQDTVTFLFTEIERSPRLWERHLEKMRAAVAHCEALLRDVVSAHRGQLLKTVGDTLGAAFTVAADAAAAALDIQQALLVRDHGTGLPLRLRMALHTGVAEERDGDYSGPALGRLTRLLTAGHGGQILLTLPAAELVRDSLPEGARLRDLGQHLFKDLDRSEQIFQLLHPDLPADFPPLDSLSTRPHNLPAALTSFVGREKEMAEVRRLLDAARLLTLTGAGGCGKTRLALQVAAGMIEAFPDGTFFVALAPVSEAGLVPGAIAQALGVMETAGRPLAESVKSYLRDRQLLLLLDNFEQVIAAAPLITGLLVDCPGLKVLVTSRESLHLTGEHEYPVPPLALPDLRNLPPAPVLSRYEAVSLFGQRAAAVRPEFAVTNENAAAVAEICHRLDGLPLAIELAAARVRLFSPQALLARLSRRLELLTGGARDLPARHQTLRSAIAWSYDLLDEAEQRLFLRLSVFVGSFTLEAAGALCTTEQDLAPDVLDSLASLVDKSLLLRRDDGPGDEPRFDMLETIREYGLERLGQSGEAETLRQQHMTFYLGLAERARSEWVGPDQRQWLDRFELEHDNLRAALDWTVEQRKAEAGLRLGAALWWFWWIRGHLSEGRRRLKTLLDLPEAKGRTRERAEVLNAAGNLVRFQGDYDEAEALYQESLAISRELDYPRGIADALANLGRIARRRGDLESAEQSHQEALAISRELADLPGIANNLADLGNVALRRRELSKALALFEESLAISRRMGRPAGIADALTNVGNAAFEAETVEKAQACYEESLAIQREINDRQGIAISLACLGRVARAQGDAETARARYREALERLRQVGDRINGTGCLEDLAQLTHTLGELEQAVSYMGAAEALREATRRPRSPADQAQWDRDLAELRRLLGENAFRRAWEYGRSMTFG